MCICSFLLFGIIPSDQSPLTFSLVLPRAVITLNADLSTLDGEYNKLSVHVAEGERENHSKKWLTSKNTPPQLVGTQSSMSL